MFTLICRFGEASSYFWKAARFNTFDEAKWAAREHSGDYLIEEDASGVAPSRVVKYRLGEFEMG